MIKRTGTNETGTVGSGVRDSRMALNVAHPNTVDVRRSLLLAVVAGAFVSVRAQPVDPSSFVFDDTDIPTVRVEMSQADFDALFAQGNQYSDVERLAAFEFERVGSVFRVDSVGFRLRGNTSRDAAKKSFKVSFNSFRRGGEFSGLEKLNLNGEHNDPTILRAKIAWDLFNRLGLPASRANHVSLFINGEYFGLYLNVEHVDEKFLKRHFGNDDGSLYKCLWPADLAFKGTDAEAYRPVDQSRRPYDLKLKDDDLSGYDDLARFITVLNTTDDARFADELERVFDVNGFLRAHAVTVLLGSWDSYWFLMNNYYLYYDPASGRFEYVPFDFDNVMGIWWDGIFPGLDWTTRNLYEWGHPNEARPLTERILAEPKFRDRYTFYLRRFLQQAFARSALEPAVLSFRDSIAEHAASDPFRSLDYGFTMQDFYDGYFGPLSNQAHVVDGILPFIEQRAASAWTQLEPVDVSPILSDLSVVPERTIAGGKVSFSIRVEDEALDRVELHYWLGTPVENVVGMTADPASGPDIFVADITAQDRDGFVDYRVEAVDALGQRSMTRLGTMAVGESVPLFINEFMASNQSSIRDPANELDDWIEIYNGGTESIGLSGFFMTDTLGIPLKWAMPDTTIPPGGFLIVWADEDGMQGPMHANFRLARGGEVVAIYDLNGALIDSVSFGQQSADVSFGRLPDGSSTFALFTSPTPGASNGTGVGIEVPSPASGLLHLKAYPNPFDGPLSVTLSSPLDEVRLEVFDVLGRRVAQVKPGAAKVSIIEWDGLSSNGSPLTAGVYIIRVAGTAAGLGGLIVSRTIPAVRVW